MSGSPICEFPTQNCSDKEVQQILSAAKVIAVVGLSHKPYRDSYRVAAYLKEKGYRIIPVNPNAIEVLGEKAYHNLGEIPEKVDLVNIFRKPEAVSEIVEAAIGIGAKVVWMQKGIVHNASADKARAAGLQVIMNKCMLKEHHNAFGSCDCSAG
ncbi:MAG: CoA-binding protein [bacterium]|nr:CoA-binding protein [bacterium]